MWDNEEQKTLVWAEKTDEERDFMQKVQRSIALMWQLKQQTLEILGGRTLQEFWDDSNEDYSALTRKSEENDPVVPYSSTISRDQADIFIASLVNQLMDLSVTAQNRDQKIDRIIGRVSRGILDYVHKNDGFPSESGQQKMARYVHKMVVEGTIHVQDDMTKEGLESSLVPNEEILIPNYWQPDIQKQGLLARIQNKVTYDEVKEQFGKFENFKYVVSGRVYNWNEDTALFKGLTEGILAEDETQVIRLWRPVPAKELKGAVRSKYFNVIIGGVPMFAPDKRQPYKDGFYPISKGISFKFSKPECYWGNSLLNKIHEDKRWLDNWKTLIRYKAKLHVLPPLISLNGLIDEEIIIPAKITALSQGVEVKKIEGVAEPISQADISILQMAESEIQRGSRAPQLEIDPQQKARSAMIMESNAQKILDAFALEVAFFIHARTYPILMRAFQFLPRRAIKEIAIPDQTLPDGRIGTLEVIFDHLLPMTKEEYQTRSLEIFKEEKAARERREPKKIEYVDIEYTHNMTFYITADVRINSLNKDAIERQAFNNRAIGLYLARPDLFNSQATARKIVQYNEDDEEILSEGGGSMFTPPMEQSALSPAARFRQQQIEQESMPPQETAPILQV